MRDTHPSWAVDGVCKDAHASERLVFLVYGGRVGPKRVSAPTKPLVVAAPRCTPAPGPLPRVWPLAVCSSSCHHDSSGRSWPRSSFPPSLHSHPPLPSATSAPTTGVRRKERAVAPTLASDSCHRQRCALPHRPPSLPSQVHCRTITHCLREWVMAVPPCPPSPPGLPPSLSPFTATNRERPCADALGPSLPVAWFAAPRHPLPPIPPPTPLPRYTSSPPHPRSYNKGCGRRGVPSVPPLPPPQRRPPPPPQRQRDIRQSRHMVGRWRGCLLGVGCIRRSWVGGGARRRVPAGGRCRGEASRGQGRTCHRRCTQQQRGQNSYVRGTHGRRQLALP